MLKTLDDYITAIAVGYADEERENTNITVESLKDSIEAALWDFVANYMIDKNLKKILEHEYTYKQEKLT